MGRAEPLTDEERAIYEWQMWVPDFGPAGQEKLKGATVLISRIGGLGSVVAYELAAAGVGRLILAHAGNVRPSDFNRQLLMTHAGLGQPRVELARRRLLELNPRLQVDAIPQNVHPGNAAALVQQADLVVDCAPRFEERLAMNDAAVRLGVPLVECAMYDMETHLFTVLPGQTACVRCLYPEAATRLAARVPGIRRGLRRRRLPGRRGSHQADCRLRHAPGRSNADRRPAHDDLPQNCSCDAELIVPPAEQAAECSGRFRCVGRGFLSTEY